MINLLNIFKKKKEEPWLDVDDVALFFESQGIDVEKMEFPDMDLRNEHPLNAYRVHFKDVTAKLEKYGDATKIVIHGQYLSQAACSHKNSEGIWVPAVPVIYDFEILDRQLKLRRTSL